LEAMHVAEGAEIRWSISDEAVATVNEDGTVTAVGSGSATVTAEVDEGGETYALTCIVRVRAESAGADLATFYTDVTGRYTMPMSMMLLEDAELLENYFTGITAIDCKQRAIYFNMMTMNNGEIAMAEVKNSADAEKVKTIFQARVDYMVESGAFYAEATAMWENNARVVSVGNYVLMVVSTDCDAIVSDFKALVG